MRPLPLLCALLCAGAAQAAPDYRDDRSTPQAVVESLYNAIDRHEYLRAWSYFAEDAAPPYATFRDGYADTDHVALRTGQPESEGAAGTIYTDVPVAIEATSTDGSTAVYTGCYALAQVSPGAQDTPPFRPIAIREGDLHRTETPFAQAMGDCR